MILVHGHRGARAIYPENTVPAFQYAISVGAHALELDVGVTQDYVLVVVHDPHLNDELIYRMTLAEIRRRQPVPGVRIPTLDEVLDLGAGNSVHFNIEIKSFPEHPSYAPAPEVFSKLVLDTIRKHRLESRAIVQSFDFGILAAIRRLDPDIRLAALYEGPPRDFVEIAREANTRIVAPEYQLVTRAQVQAAHRAGLEIIPWTVNQPGDWDRLIDAGVDAIITDDPAALLAYLKQRGLH